ncbi:MAG TPA: hypothetical protein VK689_23635, partial [Armatimonadota bacterium]|nr:hypothetical protein [Armatimonadota bacterium]
MLLAILAAIGNRLAAGPLPAMVRQDHEATPSVEELIGRLQQESQEGRGTHSTAWASGFLPLDEEARFGGGILGSARPHKSATLTELVKCGVVALPALIQHLTDPRPTKLTVGKGFMGRWFSDEYEPRHRDPRRQPPGVNKESLGTGVSREREFETYTLRVGDLCYVAVGQIVNRRLEAVRYQPSMCLVVNSPVQDLTLAEAVKADWAGLTAKEHARSLYRDAFDPTNPAAAPGALDHLLYYYPATGHSLAVKLLNRPLFNTTSALDFLLG